jgi:hypothetical protein
VAAAAQVAAQQTQPAPSLTPAPVLPSRRSAAGGYWAALAGLLCLAALLPLPSRADYPALRALYEAQRQQLAHSAFHEPINLVSKLSDNYAQGEIYAVVATPFARLRTVFQTPADWCQLAILHVNIKACTYRDDTQPQLHFYVGRKEYETPDQAFSLDYRFKTESATPDHLAISLTAPDGPFGTGNYHILLEIIPLDAGHSFLHFDYSYNYNWVARLALDTYLATLGRDKVGFTVMGHDTQHQPVYIKGIQGIVERNAMRYFFAIQAMVKTIDTPPAERLTARFNTWYDLIQRYPRQLVEYTREEYLANKAQEYLNQQALQAGEKTAAD